MPFGVHLSCKTFWLHYFPVREQLPYITNQTHIGLMATLFLTLLLHLVGLTETKTNQPSTAPSAAQSIASQADGGGTDWKDR